jgi:hypothetical protein
MSYHVNPGPNATYSSTSSQTIVDPTVGQIITFNTIEVEKGIYLETSGGIGSKMHLPQRGDYMFTISAICNATTGSNKNMAIWFRYNGSDVVRSNTTLRISSGNPQILAVSFVLPCNTPGDYYELVMSGETNNCQIYAAPAIVAPSTPVSPATPSMVCAIFQCS